MKHIHFEDEKVLGIYDPEIHATIPEPNFPITDDVWQAFLSDQVSYRVAMGTLIYAPIIKSQEEIRAEALAALDAEYTPQRKALWDYLNLAINYWQDPEAAASIRAELDALEAEYNMRAEAIFNG